jgi:hypothetical protein
MKLDTWITEVGPKVIANKLQLDWSTVRRWRTGTNAPGPKQMVILHKMSGGKVSYEDMILHFTKRRN